MITAQIPMTIKASSTALSIDEFIEYTIKNDLNIVFLKRGGTFFSKCILSVLFRLLLNGSLIPEILQFPMLESKAILKMIFRKFSTMCVVL